MNYYLTLDSPKDYYKLYNNYLLKGIRFNVCKDTDSIQKITEILIDMADKGIEVIIDIPYPYNKTRIIKTNIVNGIIRKGQKIYFTSDKAQYQKLNNCCLVSKANKPIDGNIIYYADGNGSFKIIKKGSKVIETVALNNFTIWTTKGLTIGLSRESDQWIKNVKDIFNCYSDKIRIILFLSFVTEAKDLEQFRKELSPNIRLFSKIETKESVDCIEKIIKASDGIVLARGDLLSNAGLVDFINATIKIPFLSQKYNKECFVATDILTSYYDYAIPRRSEISDVYLLTSLGYKNYIFKKNMENYQDAIMLIEKINKIKQ